MLSDRTVIHQRVAARSNDYQGCPYLAFVRSKCSSSCSFAGVSAVAVGGGLLFTVALPAFVQGGCLGLVELKDLFLGHVDQPVLVLLLPSVLLLLLQRLLLLGLVVLHTQSATGWAAHAVSDLLLLRLAQCTGGAAE